MKLLAPKHFTQFAATEYHEYVRSLYVEPERPTPPAECAIRLNAKGNPVITVRRKPKYLTSQEVDALASEIGWSKQDFWVHIRKKGIEVRLPQRAVRPLPAKGLAKKTV